MKRLIVITTLGLALGFSSFSFATDHMNLYTKPTVKSEVKNEVKGGDVEIDFTSFYTSPHTGNKANSLTIGQRSDDQSLYVFGVRLVR
jgi:hypothetical protein